MTITKESVLPLSLVAVIMSSLLGGAVWMKDQFADAASARASLNTEIRIVNLRLDRIETTLKEGVDDRFRGKDFDLWLANFHADNPTLTVPTRGH